MKRLTLLACLCALPMTQSVAQDAPKSLASTLEIYVFPADGQAADQQSKDEVECYSWAVDNTGVDPFGLQKQDDAVKEQTEAQVAAVEDATQGAGARTAVRGAAAVVGADDESEWVLRGGVQVLDDDEHPRDQAAGVGVADASGAELMLVLANILGFLIVRYSPS